MNEEPGTVSAPPPDAGPQPELRRKFSVPPWVWPLAALLALVATIVVLEYARAETVRPDRVFGFSTFLKPQNVVNILNQYAYVGVVAIGMTFVITAAGIDLSVGSMLAMLSVLGLLTANTVITGAPVTEGGAPVIQREWLGVLLGFAAILVAGAMAGTVNGLLVSWGRIAPFIVTLGGFAAFRSLALTWADSGEIRYAGGGAFSWLGNNGIAIPGTNIAGRFATEPRPMTVNWAILIWFAVAFLGWVLLNKTRFGRYAVAIGANERAALYSAVPVRTVKTLVFTLMGLLTGLAAIMSTSRLNSVGSGSSGMLLELDAIAAVVVGGTRLSGGRGTIAGTVFGVLILGAITNMLTMLDIDSNLQGLVKGAVIVLAVLIQKKV